MVSVAALTEIWIIVVVATVVRARLEPSTAPPLTRMVPSLSRLATICCRDLSPLATETSDDTLRFEKLALNRRWDDPFQGFRRRQPVRGSVSFDGRESGCGAVARTLASALPGFSSAGKCVSAYSIRRDVKPVAFV